jgi:hypothetical protein
MSLNRLDRFNLLVKKAHIYIALLNLSIVLVFGIAGLKATLNDGKYKPPEPEVHFENFIVPAALIDDSAVAEEIRRRLSIPAVGIDIRRDEENNLNVAYYTHSGPRRITLLETENRLRIAKQQEDIWHYFDNLHGTANRHPSDWRVRLWTYYNEFSVWSLIAMAVSGVYLWLCSRPGYLWAQVSFLAGTAAVLVLYLFSR